MPKIRSLTHISVACIFSSLGPHERESGGDEYFNYWFPRFALTALKIASSVLPMRQRTSIPKLHSRKYFHLSGQVIYERYIFFLVNGAALNISCLTYRIISKMFQWQKMGRDRQGGKEDEIPLCLLFIPYSAE